MAIVKDLTVSQFFEDLQKFGGMKEVEFDEDFQPEDELPDVRTFSKVLSGRVKIELIVQYSMEDQDLSSLVDTSNISIMAHTHKNKKLHEEVTSAIGAKNKKEFYPEFAIQMQNTVDIVRDKIYKSKGEDVGVASAQQKRYIHGMVEAIEQFGVLPVTLTKDQVQNLNRDEAHALIKKLKPAYASIYEKFKASKRKK